MEDIKIESGVPLPMETRGRKPKYPFKYMDVEDSFFIECEEDKQRKLSNSLRGCAKMHSRKSLGRKEFKVLVEKNGVRVFRVA